MTAEEAKRLFDNCSGECDNCKYHYYIYSKYCYGEPKIRCRLDDILAEVKE